MKNVFDVLIVGGGLVGLTLANALAKNGQLSICIVETKELINEPVTEQFYLRVSAINHASRNILQNLQVWPKILRMTPYEKMFVWDHLGQGKISFDCTELAKNNLGYIIENHILQNSLLETLREYDHVTIINATQPHKILYHADKILLELADKQILSAKLLVGADGPHSWVRQQAGINSHSWSYDHLALVTTIKTELPHQLTAWQCFHDEGILALLPLPHPDYCSIVWSLKPTRGEFLAECSDQQFNQIISETFEHRLGQIEKCDRLIKFPLIMRHVKNYIRPRIALVGDAAHTIHPLAGQGVNIGLLDAACLAQIILNSKLRRHDIGQYPYLRRFERWRKGDNWLMIMAMEIFKHLFASPTSAVIKTRKLGLQISDHNSFIKNQFIHHALGLKGDLPELARETVPVSFHPTQESML